MRSQYRDTVTRRNAGGVLEPLENIRVSVFERGTTDPVVIYTTRTGGTTKDNPFTTELDGISTFYVENDTPYDVVYHDLDGTPRINDYTIQPPFPAEDGGIPQEMIASGGVMPTGLILPFAGASPPPAGYLLCDGAAISRVDYSTLFSVIGTTYGIGNGSTTFNVPELRGRGIVGAGNGTGLTPRSRGQTGGAETHQLAVEELPAHEHPIDDAGHSHPIEDPGHSHQPSSGTSEYYLQHSSGGNIIGHLQASSDGSPAARENSRTGTSDTNLENTESAETGLTATGENVDGGDAHANMPPFGVAYWVIKT